MSQANNQNLSRPSSEFIKKFLVWLPIIVGVIHQFVMLMWGMRRIYVFVDPPGYITPWVSLEFQWWIVLFFVTALMFILLFFDRLTSIPERIIYPVYAYLVFLLIFVEPV